MGVDRCVCHEVSFEQLKRLAESRGLDLEGLKRETGCCTGCSMCEPYVRLMLRTGRTDFEPLTSEQVERALRDASPPG